MQSEEQKRDIREMMELNVEDYAVQLGHNIVEIMRLKKQVAVLSQYSQEVKLENTQLKEQLEALGNPGGEPEPSDSQESGPETLESI